jgi:formylglycine-generating enzyme required for sulfatase activity
MKKLFVVLFLITVVCAVSFSQQNVSAPQKYALVIGNGAYTNYGSLRNAENDANDMADALKGLGFNVDKVINGNLNQMENAAVRLKNQLAANSNAYGFFYYAGHGIQWQGENYLIPVDANIPESDFLRQRAVSVQTILDMLNKTKNSLNIVILDACRNFPAVWSRSTDRGLAVVNPFTDSIIMFATGAGKTASDGAGRNGLFTDNLLRNLKTPGIEVKDLFWRTMSDVARASNNEQRPALYTDFAETAYLGAKPSATVVDPKPDPSPSPAPAPAVTTNIPANMVRVEGGTFQMGSNVHDSEKPIRAVTVKGFYMGKYPVTQKEWFEVMGTNPSYFKGDNLPVEPVSWLDAVEYCNRRSIKEGLTPAYSGSGNNITCNWNANGYRLPTEAEWEYAAKGGNRDPIVYEYSGSNSVDSVAWYTSNSGGGTRPVGTKAPNSLGLYDMSGNVWEWCWDWYGSYPAGAQTDPQGASSGSLRVRRGGGGRSSAQGVRSAVRGSYAPSDRFNFLGFRLVRNAQ